MVTHCLSESGGDGEETGWISEGGGGVIATANAGTTAAASTPNNDTTYNTSNHPCLQTRYTDRRRNTPLHLA